MCMVSPIERQSLENKNFFFVLVRVLCMLRVYVLDDDDDDG